MAWLRQSDYFDPDSLDVPVVGIAAEMGQHDSGIHQHDMGQLLFTQRGCIKITLADQISILPPTRVAWIPPKTWHRAEMRGSVGYRSIYLNVLETELIAERSEVLEATPLLQALLERIAISSFDLDWYQGKGAHLLAVFFDEIREARREQTLLPLPFDRRLAGLSFEQLPPPLHTLATYIGASEKTITRIFHRETGMNYQQWRQQWRLVKAIELLAQNKTLSYVAQELGFVSDSAFVTFFRKFTGKPPRAYMAGS
ncbi:AraC family transcriptional regulator [Xenorhabdus szentirmaii]|uniref:HTH araC/xylS-type domain-containing protein n=2 Tax=Xenorhabdus szentirmaii TaxID=290112 RepID=W1IY05_9GAMM|nr:MULTISPECIES: helix-turn-helix transcriptional regulator [Xenorhabdus]MBD2780487.1 helix-turn-helix transcriptional regulator [Xenorhabdus sp. 38]MBD2791212.1 helix-turn-helix transcriptional regulator [Xenorhabdus sp. CUL]MBD2799359.1 helix-turn-helix transcriptional regulator [Xenorhabdus sp. M]MBD2805387.1 helix-turn-helix transcriptional regulator [Xenorhabdus sp. ZM]MBD2819415.1 helix-turn-helix transcriptional regulator [Xenorhabdus sp. 42]